MQFNSFLKIVDRKPALFSFDQKIPTILLGLAKKTICCKRHKNCLAAYGKEGIGIKRHGRMLHNYPNRSVPCGFHVG